MPFGPLLAAGQFQSSDYVSGPTLTAETTSYTIVGSFSLRAFSFSITSGMYTINSQAGDGDVSFNVASPNHLLAIMGMGG